MVNHARELKDQDFLYAYLTEYLDDQLPADQKSRFEKGLAAENLDSLTTDFGICRGQLQIALQKLYLDEAQIHQLHTLVEDDAARANHEAHVIEDVGRSELLGNSMRGVFLLVLIGAIAAFAYTYLAPKKKIAFAPLDTLMYESLVMIEEPVVRLDFPTDKVDELRDYFVRYPDLGFRVRQFQSPGAEWGLVGGSVIDYEIAKIATAQFLHRRQGEYLFLYMFEGQLTDLPYAQPGNSEGLIYQAYASDRLNVIAWQVSNNILGMAMGSGGTEDLAKVAKKSIGLY
ncbi:MAG: hypothetical protein ACOH5I_16605 [Oligoflexus sp.]